MEESGEVWISKSQLSGHRMEEMGVFPSFPSVVKAILFASTP